MSRWFGVLGIGVLGAGAALGGAVLLRSSDLPHSTDTSSAPGGAPRAVVEQSTRDLGVLDPADPCKHLFVVRNEGTAPLRLAKAGTSCQCTVSVLPKGEIPPGMGGPVEVESKLDGQSEGPFRHTAAFLTNDPQTPRIELTIQGEVRSYLAVSPSGIHLGTLRRGQPAEASVLIGSQAWEAFSVAAVQSSIEGLAWDFQPAPPEKLAELNARSGYAATFRVPADRVGTGFSGWVEVVARGARETPEGQERTIRIPLSGRVPPLRTVYGKEVDHEGVVRVGFLAQGKGAKVRLLLRVRGDDREIRVEKIETRPDFLKASVEPHGGAPADKGLYSIFIEVPEDAPLCNFWGPDGMGEVRVLTDHPEMPEIVKLRVEFAVMEPHRM